MRYFKFKLIINRDDNFLKKFKICFKIKFSSKTILDIKS